MIELQLIVAIHPSIIFCCDKLVKMPTVTWVLPTSP